MPSRPPNCIALARAQSCKPGRIEGEHEQQPWAVGGEERERPALGRQHIVRGPCCDGRQRLVGRFLSPAPSAPRVRREHVRGRLTSKALRREGAWRKSCRVRDADCRRCACSALSADAANWPPAPPVQGEERP
jgi:hypothetical protein